MHDQSWGAKTEKKSPSPRYFPKPKIPQAASLVKGVTTVNDDIGAGHEAGSVGRKEDAEAVEIVNGTQTLLGSQRLPDLLLGVKGRDLVQGGIHVTGGNAVNTDVILGPLGSKRLAELNDTSLGGVVARLLLRVVDDGARHRGNKDNGAGLASGHHGAADGLGHQERAVEVDVNETTEHGSIILLGRNVRVGNTGRVDHDVGSAIEVNNVLDGSVDGAAITNIYLEE